MIGPYLRDITVRPWRKDEAFVLGVYAAIGAVLVVSVLINAVSR